MRKCFVLIALINIVVGIIAFIFFVVLGGFDLYLGKGSPIWLCWIPSVFFVGSAANFISVYMNFKVFRENRANTID